MKEMISLLLLLIAGFAFTSSTAADDNIGNTDAESIQQLMADKHIPGLALAKIENGSVIFIKTHGYANIAQHLKVTPDTMFNIASISKPIMGISLLQLVDKKLLSLDDDINNYLPFKVDNPFVENDKITLRQLATHTSGIADYYQPSGFSENIDSPVSLKQHLLSVLVQGGAEYNQGQYFLKQPPGTVREYSNLGAGLAGYLVEAVTDEPLSAYSQRTLFRALQMEHTAWLLQGLELSKLAVPYEVSDTGQLIPHAHVGNPQYPDGGLRSSIRDLASLMVAFLNNKDKSGNALLPDLLHQQMLTLQLPMPLSSRQRLFWSDNSMGMTGHMGSDIGAFCAFYFDRASQNGFIILMNVSMNDDSVSAMKTLAQQLTAE